MGCLALQAFIAGVGYIMLLSNDTDIKSTAFLHAVQVEMNVVWECT